VRTYGEVAAAIGYPRAARAVGNALHRNPYQGIVPCHRVVDRCGMLAKDFGFGGAEAQKLLLEREGVTVTEDRAGYRVRLGNAKL